MNLHNLPSKVLKFLGRYSWSVLTLAALIVILVTSQAERYAHRGTVLGYQLAHKTPAVTVKTPGTRSVGPAPTPKSQTGTASIATPNQKSLVCTKLPADKVGAILRLKIDKAQSFIPDRKGPNEVSYCNYRSVVDTKAKPSVRTVSLLYRSYAAADEASRVYNVSTARGQKVDVKKFADSAYYIDSLNQLTVRKGTKLLVITVSQPTAGAIASQEAALAIAQTGLLN